MLTNESAELCQVTGRGPIRAESPTAAPPAAPGTRAVSVSEESPRCEDTADSSEITNENESDARAAQCSRSVSNNSEGWTTTSTTSTSAGVSADYQGSCGEERTGSSDTASDTASMMAAVKTETAGFKRNSFLRRSDSYRRAKTSNVLLTPDLDKRKSVEVTGAANNNNNSKTEMIITSPAPAPVKQPEKPKNNFFRSLRSSLSFSSLRVKKSQQRPRLNISNPLEAQNTGKREVIIL